MKIQKMIDSFTKQAFVFLVVAGVILGATVFLHELAGAPSMYVQQEVEEEPALNQKNPFDELALEARAVYVYDISRGEVLFERNADIQLPLASITKVMTALVAEELSDSGVVTIHADAIEQEGDSGLLVGETWALSDLRDFMLLESSNDGAFALASAGSAHMLGAEEGVASTTPEEYFLAEMNRQAQALGMEKTFFLNTNGLDLHDDTASGAYGSARDVATLFSYIISAYPALLEATAYSGRVFTSDSAIHTAQNTNEVVGDIPMLLASKTGFTDLAGGNLAVVFEAGPLRPIVVVVLSSTPDGRFTDVKQLVDASIQSVIPR